jgi:hypothetical protein
LIDFRSEFLFLLWFCCVSFWIFVLGICFIHFAFYLRFVFCFSWFQFHSGFLVHILFFFLILICWFLLKFVVRAMLVFVRNKMNKHKRVFRGFPILGICFVLLSNLWINFLRAILVFDEQDEHLPFNF